jgi:hypothetical protein
MDRRARRHHPMQVISTGATHVRVEPQDQARSPAEGGPMDIFEIELSW